MPTSTNCPSCRRGIFPDDAFCSWCGTRVQSGRTGAPGVGRTQAYQTVQTNERTPCHSCNGPVLPGDAFCSACGAQVGASRAEVVGESWTRIAREIQGASRGKYEVVRELGRGGMGVVFLARDKELHRRVAIKVLAPSLLTDDAMVQRFLREARIIASLRHESIVSIYDVGQAGDLRYFVMDFIDGVSLGQVLRSRGPLPIPLVEAIFYQVGQALAYVHRSARGLVHRDVKPSNVMLDPEGIAVLMDFGISKLDEAGGGITRTGLVMGTPEYMSPEQCRGLVATPESDQYALGALAYAMLTGRPPFSGPFYQVLVAHQNETVRPIRELRADCPPNLAAAVERMLAKLPGDRWSSIGEALRGIGLRPLLPDDPLRGELARLVAEGKGAPVPEGSAATSGQDGSLDLPPTRLRIDPLPEVFRQGDVFALRATLLFESGTPVPGVPLSWHSTDPGVARVDPETGEMEAVGIGQATLFAVGGGLAESVAVEVRPPMVASVHIEPELASLEPGAGIQFQASPCSARGIPVNELVVWETSDPGVLTVNSDGWGLAVGDGTARVVARCQTVEGVALVRVQLPFVRPSTPLTAPSQPATPVEPPLAKASATTVPRTSSRTADPRGRKWPFFAGLGALLFVAVFWSGRLLLEPSRSGQLGSTPEDLAATAVALGSQEDLGDGGGGSDLTGPSQDTTGDPTPSSPAASLGTGPDRRDLEPVQAPPAAPSSPAPAAGGESTLPLRNATPPSGQQAVPNVEAPPPPLQPGRLRLQIRPFAEVFLNGVPRGDGFDVAVEDLAPGRYQLRLEHPTLQPVDTVVVVEAGVTTTVQRVLQPRNDP